MRSLTTTMSASPPRRAGDPKHQERQRRRPKKLIVPSLRRVPIVREVNEPVSSTMRSQSHHGQQGQRGQRGQRGRQGDLGQRRSALPSYPRYPSPPTTVTTRRSLLTVTRDSGRIAGTRTNGRTNGREMICRSLPAQPPIPHPQVVESRDEVLAAPPAGQTTVWRNRDFIILLAGQIVSLAGTGASQLAFPLLVLWLTHSPTQMGIEAALYLLPYVALCLPVGALVDRWDRKRVMIVCDGGRALLLFSVGLGDMLGWLTIWQLYVVSILQGTLFCCFDLAATAALPQVAPAEQLATASSAYAATLNGSQLVGPALGGFLYSLSRAVPFLTDAISYLLSAFSLCWIRTPFQQSVRPERAPQSSHHAAGQVSQRASPALRGSRIVATPSVPSVGAALPPHVSLVPARVSLRRDVADGLTWLWRHSLLRSLALLSGGANLVLAAFPLVCFVLARHAQANAIVTGIILASAGAGGVLGSLLSARLLRRVPFEWLFLGGLAGAAVIWLLMALVTAPWLIALGALSAMTSEQVASMAQYTLRLRLIPDELQGRVNSAYRLLLLLSQPVGLAVGGALLDQLGVQATLVIGSLILAAVVFAGAIPLAPTRQATQATARTRLARLARQWRRSAQFLHSQYVRRALEGDITQGRTGK